MVKMMKVNFSPHATAASFAIVANSLENNASAPQPGHISDTG